MQAIGRKDLQSTIANLQQQKNIIDQTTKAYDVMRQQADQLQSKRLELAKFQTQKETIISQISELQERIAQQEKQ
jgi:hypothetical protein